MHHIYARCTIFITNCKCYLVDARVEVFLERRHRRDVLLAFAREHLRDTGLSSTRRGHRVLRRTAGSDAARDCPSTQRLSRKAAPPHTPYGGRRVVLSQLQGATGRTVDPRAGVGALSNLMRSSDRSFSSLVRSFSALSSSYRCNSRSVGDDQRAAHIRQDKTETCAAACSGYRASRGSPILRSAFVGVFKRMRRGTVPSGVRSMPTGQDRRAAQPQCSAEQCRLGFRVSAISCASVRRAARSTAAAAAEMDGLAIRY